MTFIVCAFNHQEWARYKLQDYNDFADLICECNIGEDSFSGYGEWYYIAEDTLPNNDRVIYYGPWGNDNSPGASCYTYAEIFNMDDAEDIARFRQMVQQWEAQPEYDPEQQRRDEKWGLYPQHDDPCN